MKRSEGISERLLEDGNYQRWTHVSFVASRRTEIFPRKGNKSCLDALFTTSHMDERRDIAFIATGGFR